MAVFIHKEKTVEQPKQIFKLDNLTGQDIEAVMAGLSELPAKLSRNTLNKIEGQVVAQIMASQAPQPQQTSTDTALE